MLKDQRMKYRNKGGDKQNVQTGRLGSEQNARTGGTNKTQEQYFKHGGKRLTNGTYMQCTN